MMDKGTSGDRSIRRSGCVGTTRVNSCPRQACNGLFSQHTLSFLHEWDQRGSPASPACQARTPLSLSLSLSKGSDACRFIPPSLPPALSARTLLSLLPVALPALLEQDAGTESKGLNSSCCSCHPIRYQDQFNP